MASHACVTRHAKVNVYWTHGKPCVHMHANGEVYKRREKSIRRGGEEQNGKKGKKKGREEEGEKEICVPTVGTHRTKK